VNPFEQSRISLNPILDALGPVISRLQLPIELFREPTGSFHPDITQDRHTNFTELMDYCRSSANPL
jgi:phytoene/squalene synthetase